MWATTNLSVVTGLTQATDGTKFVLLSKAGVQAATQADLPEVAFSVRLYILARRDIEPHRLAKTGLAVVSSMRGFTVGPQLGKRDLATEGGGRRVIQESHTSGRFL